MATVPAAHPVPPPTGVPIAGPAVHLHVRKADRAPAPTPAPAMAAARVATHPASPVRASIRSHGRRADRPAAGKVRMAGPGVVPVTVRPAPGSSRARTGTTKRRV